MQTATQPPSTGRRRGRDLGIQIGRLHPGRWNAITDVSGVRVGHTTLIEGEGPLVVGQGPVRTGVTVILPHEGDVGVDPVFAAYHLLNGNGEMTGLPWIEESGLLTTPVAITNTHSVGTVRDAIIAYNVRHGGQTYETMWSLPVVAETYDGFLNDINGFHVKPEHVFAALDHAASGPVVEGCVGGGTGMIAHGFKGGIGTSSRVVPWDLKPSQIPAPPTSPPAPPLQREGSQEKEDQGEGLAAWTVGILVQANYGSRYRLTVDGVPVGREITPAEVPLPRMSTPPPAPPLAREGSPTSPPAPPLTREGSPTSPPSLTGKGAGGLGPPDDPGAGSIIVIIATDAPLLPTGCRRLAQRAALGIGRMGGLGENSSGDIILAFSTGNRGLNPPPGTTEPIAVRMVANDAMSPLFEAVVDATEEAILNALCMAETMVGVDGHTAHALPLDRLVAVMRKYGRLIDRSY